MIVVALVCVLLMLAAIYAGHRKLNKARRKRIDKYEAFALILCVQKQMIFCCREMQARVERKAQQEREMQEKATFRDVYIDPDEP